MAPATCKALVVEGNRLALEAIDTPEPGPHQVLVKVSHMAQNPIDVQGLDLHLYRRGDVLGCDFAGTVDEVGAGVTTLAKGDVVASFIHGGERPGLGAYSEYTLADERRTFKVPPGVSPAEAATVPLAAVTAWLALFSPDCLGIDRGGGSDVSVLIWGGSSSVGLYSIQLAAIHGFQVLTTCSMHNFGLVRTLGADHVLDYRDPDVMQGLAQAAPQLAYVLDAVGDPTSSATASQALCDDEDGALCTVRPGRFFTDRVKPGARVSDVLVWTVLGRDVSFGGLHWPARPRDVALGEAFFAQAGAWLRDRKLRGNPPKVYAGGFADVEAGFQEFRDGKVSGYKIVYAL